MPKHHIRGGKEMTKHPFRALGLGKSISQVTDQLYFKEATPIQAQSIPIILAGKSLVGQSQTGSGKTHAFLLPLLDRLDESKNEVQVVITAPTRELAMQLFEEIKAIRKIAHKEEDWRARLIIGGLDRERMMRQLEGNVPHIVVGTPGRILDMVDAGVLSIYRARSFVIDEADLMLDLKFIEEIDQLLVRSAKDIQILVFSATIPEALQHFIKKYLRQPETIQIGRKSTPAQLEHRLIELREGMDEKEKLLDLIKVIHPFVAIVFTNSKQKTEELARYLAGEGLKVAMLHGDLSSRERMRVVRGIHELQYEYIVATDLASRGIDIKGVSHVINLELPKEREFYIHRTGRTARAGGSGMAISFFTKKDHPLIESLEGHIPFIFSDIQNGSLIEVKHFDRKKARPKRKNELDRLAWQRVKKPKKVKPGYRKKMQREQQRIKQELKRKRNKGRRNK